MKIVATELNGLRLIEHQVFSDRRGRLVKPFSADEFRQLGIPATFRESFYSCNVRGVIRGMHFQTPPLDHDKLVHVISGEIIDVALDLRTSSASYGRSASFRISSDAGLTVYVPRGFAHGFGVLSEAAVVIYYTTTVRSSQHEAGVRWDSFGLDWPIGDPIISDRDRQLPALAGFGSPF